MIRWASCGLVVAVVSVVSAQTADMITEVTGGRAAPLRPNPFGGAPITQVAFPAAGQPLVQFKAAPVPPPAAGGDEAPVPPNLNPRPGRPVFTLPGPPRLDRHGDPLPAGAVARFGTNRLRHGADVQGMVFTQDAKLLCTVSGTDDSVRMWDTATGKEVARLNSAAELVGLARDGSVVAVAETRIRVWLPATNTVRDLPEKTLPEDASPSALADGPSPPW